MSNQNDWSAAPDHIADARKMVRGEPASGVPSRDELIQCLLATRGQSEGTTADAILSMLTAAPTAPGVGSGPLPANRYGVDCNYFTEKLEILIRDMGNYTPDELARSLGRLAMTANSETMREPEFNTAPAVQGEPEIEPYDAGSLNDFGGGDVGWWHDYIRAELDRAYEFYLIQLSAAPQPAPRHPDRRRER